jgi:hypothetical protein
LNWGSFSYFENCANANSQCHARNLAHIAAEEAGIGEHGIVGKRLHASPRGQAGSGLIEGNVAIWTNTTEEKLNASVGLDLCLVLAALNIEIRGIAIQNVDIAGVDINM